MPRKEQGPRWEYRQSLGGPISDRSMFHGYTDWGIKMIETGFMLRITQPELFPEGKYRDELCRGRAIILDPYTKDLEQDIINSCLSDEVVDNLLCNSRNRQ
jgi:hypothetical protein